MWGGFGFHAFRHTCASLLFDEGRNVKQVQRWLSHHSAAFTPVTYVHLLPDEIAAPLDVEVQIEEASAERSIRRNETAVLA